MTIQYGTDYTCEHGEPPGDCPPCDQAMALWSARPVLGHILTFARARRVSPWAVLGVVFTRIVVATPPFVVLPAMVGGQQSLNLFVGLVGPSGAGKGAAEAVAAEAVDIVGDPIDPIGVGSGEGIPHLYMKRTKDGIEQHTQAVMLSVPEVDTLTALSDRRGSTLLPELRKAWTGEGLGFAYADPSKRLPLRAHMYRLGLVVGIQPGRAAALLDDSDGGTPQRFLWLPATDPDAPDVPPEEPEPLPWKLPLWPNAMWPSKRVVLRVCDEARSTIDAQRLARLRGHADALDGHALLARLKVAAALALLEGGTEVDDEDWRLAGLVMETSDRTRTEVAETLKRATAAENRRRGEAEAERAVVVAERVERDVMRRVSQAITRRLARAEGDWVSGSDLRSALAPTTRQHFGPAIEHLVTGGQVEERETNTSGAGRAGVQYRLAERAR